VYHCHILEHEDKGMMGSIRVDPPATTNNQARVRADEGQQSDAAAPSRVAQRSVKSH